jgi:dephospho-CoA kinase
VRRVPRGPAPYPLMLVVGLTGGIGAGKSTVARMLADRGAVVLDLDAVARGSVGIGTPGYEAVVEAFGEVVVEPDGELDRAALASLVFADDERRRALEAIVHPLVRERIARTVVEHTGTDRVVVLDSPLLVETGGDREVGYVVVVRASPEVRLARLVARGMSAEDVRARMAAQSTDAEREAAADTVLDNDGVLEELAVGVDELWAELTRLSSAR